MEPNSPNRIQNTYNQSNKVDQKNPTEKKYFTKFFGACREAFSQDYLSDAHGATYRQIEALCLNPNIDRPTQQSFKNLVRFVESRSVKQATLFRKGLFKDLEHSAVLYPNGSYDILLGKDHNIRSKDSPEVQGTFKKLRRGLRVNPDGNVTEKAVLKVFQDIDGARKEHKNATFFSSQYVVSPGDEPLAYEGKPREGWPPNELLMISDWAEQGDADHYFNGPNKPSKEEAMEVFYEMACGLQALHKVRFMHRDVKPGNYLIFQGYDGKPHAKLADLATVHPPMEEGLKFAGTPHYFPVRPVTIKTRSQTLRDDVYALGKSVQELWGDISEKGDEQVQKLDELLEKMMDCEQHEDLQIDEEVRTFKRLMLHPFHN